jgi:antitoxin HigA-1
VKRISAIRPPTPSSALREVLKEIPDVTQESLAAALRVTRYSVNQLVNGKRNITPEMAVRLGKVLGTSPEFWLNLQMKADLATAQQDLKREVGTLKPLRRQSSERDLFYEY